MCTRRRSVHCDRGRQWDTGQHRKFMKLELQVSAWVTLTNGMLGEKQAVIFLCSMTFMYSTERAK